MYRFRTAVLVVFGCIAGFSPAFAQSRAPSHASDAAIIAEMERYRLTIADAKKLVEAGKNLDANPAAARAMQSLPRTGTNATAELGRALQGNADVTKALGEAGLSVREFLKITTVWLAVSFADLMPEAEAMKMLKEAHIHPDNLTFYRQNKQALNGLQ